MEEERIYKVLFFILESEKKVHAELSFAQDMGAVLRKHWNGGVTGTKALFSHENPQAEPKMWVWNIGCVQRRVAFLFLQRWEAAFSQKGFEIIGSQLKEKDMTQAVRLGFEEIIRWEKIDPDKLMQGIDCRIVSCGKSVRKKRSAAQKYAVEASEEKLSIRTTYEEAEAFRSFCGEKKLTQSQGLALLLKGAGKDPEAGPYWDLLARLNEADEANQEKDRVIAKLKKDLEKEKNSKKTPRRVQAAEIQNMLFKAFFEGLPTPLFSEAYMKRHSAKASKREFPEQREYHFPEKEGVVVLYLEHVSYPVGESNLLFVFGKTETGEKIKLCERYLEKDKFGVSLWNSPYLIRGYPWSFGVQKPGEIAYIVGSLPVLDLDRVTQWYEQPDDVGDGRIRTSHYEVLPEMTEDALPKDQGEQEAGHNPIIDRDASIDEKIEFAERQKRRRG